jgi:hypothetical protein
MSTFDVSLIYSPHEHTGSDARRVFYSMVARRLFLLKSTSHRGGPGSSPSLVMRICGGQSSAGAGFLRVLRFPLPIFIPPNAAQSPSSIIWGWYNRPISDRRTKWTQAHTTPRN